MGSPCPKRLKATFSLDWLEHENYTTWIREVPNDNTSYFCTVCNNTFSCSSRVSRHANSETHRNNMLRDPLEELPRKPKTEFRKKSFCYSWLENKQFKPWLEKVPNDPYNCFCSFCNATFRCGLDALKRHADTKKHISECQKRGIDPSAIRNEESSDQPVFEDRKKVAEIRFATLIAEKNIPFQTAETILSFFKDLGKDPAILQSMTMNRKKGPEIINKVLYLREQERIVEILRNNKFSIFIDEISDTINNKWITFFVRYVDPRTLDIRMELFKLIHLDSSDYDAVPLFTNFKDEMEGKEIPFENILALSCDNAFVTTETYEYFKTKLKKYCKNLITMLSPCHACTLIINSASTAIPEECEDLFRKMVSFISNNPKRAGIFQKFQKPFNLNDNKKDSNLCQKMQWLSHHSCVVALNKNWNELLELLQEEKLNENSSSEAALLSMMQNPEIQAYFLFLEYILHPFKKFNASFQSQETKIYLLQSAADNLLRNVLRNVAKTTVANFTENDTINSLFVCNRQSPEQIVVGAACQNLLDQLSQKGQDEIVSSVYNNCLTFYNIAAKEIRRTLFVKEEFLIKLRVFEPKLALKQEDEKRPNKSVDDVLMAAKELGEFDEKALREEWQSLDVDFTSEEKKRIIKLSFDDAWKTMITTKDAEDKFKYPTLMKLVNAIRSLPSTNINTERMSSMLSDVRTKKRNKLYPIHVQALCVLKSSLKARGQTARTMTIDARHLALMTTQNLYHSSAKSSFVAYECPSTSSDL